MPYLNFMVIILFYGAQYHALVFLLVWSLFEPAIIKSIIIETAAIKVQFLMTKMKQT